MVNQKELTALNSLLKIENGNSEWRKEEIGLCKKLTVKGIPGQVGIAVAPNDACGYFISAGEKFLSKLQVNNDGNGNVEIKGPASSSSTIIVSGFGSISVSGNVSINGKKINIDDDSDGIQPKMVIFVNEGTHIKLKDVNESRLLDVKGKIDIDLCGSEKSFVKSCKGAKIDCSGQSFCQVYEASGHINIDCSGQSRTELTGNIDEAILETSGQSSIIISGNVDGDVEADASGQSTITCEAKVSGSIDQDKSGQSRIIIR